MKPFKEELHVKEDLHVKPFKQEAQEIDVKSPEKPIEFLGSFSSVFLGFCIFILVLAFAKSVQSVEEVFSGGGLSSYLYLAGFLLLLTVLSFFTYQNIVQIQKIKSVENIKKSFKTQKQNPDKSIVELGNFLVKHYEKNVDEKLLKEIKSELESVGIYENIYESLDKKLLTHIDEKAKKAITNASLQGALSTAISPVALVDMALIVYRSIALTKEIALLYGYKPTMSTTMILLKKGMVNVMFAGVVELASEFTNQASSSFLSKASKQLGSGVANGILLARLGFGVLEACRPIEYEGGKSSFFKMFLELLKDAFSQKS